MNAMGMLELSDYSPAELAASKARFDLAPFLGRTVTETIRSPGVHDEYLVRKDAVLNLFDIAVLAQEGVTADYLSSVTV